MTYDALIMGAGLIGTTLALSLEQAGFHIALVDAKPRLSLDNAQDLRTVALSLASIKWLKKTGVWAALHEKEKSPYTKMCIFESSQKEPLLFDAQETASSCLGYIVSHDKLLLAAQSLLKNNVFFETPIQTLAEMNSFNARIILGCDGADSFLRQAAGITQQMYPYEQTALVAELHCEKWHEHTAWQSFAQNQIMGLLPLQDRYRVNMIWSLDQEKAKAMMLLSPLDIEKHIQSLFGDRLGTLTLHSRMGSFPLIARHAHQYGNEKIILLGDAIHTVHPLAGQGVNLGFLDAAALCDILKQTTIREWNNAKLCATFERQRKAHNFMMTHLMTALKEGYAKEGVLGQARRFGVRILNGLPSVKKILVRSFS